MGLMNQDKRRLTGAGGRVGIDARKFFNSIPEVGIESDITSKCGECQESREEGSEGGE
jgi:hypothetical protein